VERLRQSVALHRHIVGSVLFLKEQLKGIIIINATRRRRSCRCSSDAYVPAFPGRPRSRLLPPDRWRWCLGRAKRLCGPHTRQVDHALLFALFRVVAHRLQVFFVTRALLGTKQCTHLTDQDCRGASRGAAECRSTLCVAARPCTFGPGRSAGRLIVALRNKQAEQCQQDPVRATCCSPGDRGGGGGGGGAHPCHSRSI
jgi:hypothetical protein